MTAGEREAIGCKRTILQRELMTSGHKQDMTGLMLAEVSDADVVDGCVWGDGDRR